jgi:hypothetical protein
VYVGLRDVDKGERDLIHEHKIMAFTMSHIDRYGIGGVMKMATDYLGDRPLHLSYDIDACDPCMPLLFVCVGYYSSPVFIFFKKNRTRFSTGFTQPLLRARGPWCAGA